MDDIFDTNEESSVVLHDETEEFVTSSNLNNPSKSRKRSITPKKKYFDLVDNSEETKIDRSNYPETSLSKLLLPIIVKEIGKLSEDTKIREILCNLLNNIRDLEEYNKIAETIYDDIIHNPKIKQDIKDSTLNHKIIETKIDNNEETKIDNNEETKIDNNEEPIIKNNEDRTISNMTLYLLERWKNRINSTS